MKNKSLPAIITPLLLASSLSYSGPSPNAIQTIKLCQDQARVNTPTSHVIQDLSAMALPLIQEKVALQKEFHQSFVAQAFEPPKGAVVELYPLFTQHRRQLDHLDTLDEDQVDVEREIESTFKKNKSSRFDLESFDRYYDETLDKIYLEEASLPEEVPSKLGKGLHRSSWKKAKKLTLESFQITNEIVETENHIQSLESTIVDRLAGLQVFEDFETRIKSNTPKGISVHISSTRVNIERAEYDNSTYELSPDLRFESSFSIKSGKIQLEGIVSSSIHRDQYLDPVTERNYRFSFKTHPNRIFTPELTQLTHSFASIRRSQKIEENTNELITRATTPFTEDLLPVVIRSTIRENIFAECVLNSSLALDKGILEQLETEPELHRNNPDRVDNLVQPILSLSEEVADFFK